MFKGLFYFLLLLGQKLLKEIVFRILSIIFFPIAYYFRDEIRTYLYSWDEELIREVTFSDTRNVSVPKMTLVTRLVWFLWLFLDDSPAKDNTYNGKPSYDSSCTRKYYPTQWIYDNKILRDTWWSLIRNNSVNYISWNNTGGWKTPLEVETLWGYFDENIDKSDDNSYYVPGMYLVRILHNDGSTHSRFTLVSEVFGRKFAFWIGKSSGSGRFSFSMRA